MGKGQEQEAEERLDLFVRSPNLLLSRFIFEGEYSRRSHVGV